MNLGNSQAGASGNVTAVFFKARGEPFPLEGWQHILKAHGGDIPLRIKAVAEGSVVPVSNALFTVESTDPAVPWVVSWFETLLVRVWKEETAS